MRCERSPEDGSHVWQDTDERVYVPDTFCGSAATQSTSMSQSSFTRREIATAVLAGRCVPRNCSRAAAIFERSSMSRKYQLSLTMLSMVAPEPVRIRWMFL